MKITEIRISVSRTVNLGDYNSLKIEGECVVDPGMNSMEEARQFAMEEVKTQLSEAYKKFKLK